MDWFSSFDTNDWLVLGGTVAVLGAVLWYKSRDYFRFRRHARFTEGTIVNWMAASQGGKHYFHPLIEFYTEGGERLVHRAEERCEGEPMYPVGTKVKVRYLPGSPPMIKIDYPPEVH